MNQRANTGRTELVSMAMVALWALLWVSVSQGQTTSITSSGLNTHVSHGVGSHNYYITGGTRPGNGTNLFESFGDFSVGTHDAAVFLNNTHLPTTNILSRVTGGRVSSIFGQINTANFPGANLYLINPAGVLFGPTATLNVSGSVHISTADYLRLADGLRFNAIPGPQDTLLSQAPVIAFGFLNPHPRSIIDNGLQSGVGSPVLSLIGGNVKVSGGSLTASREINLVSLASRGEVRVGASGEPSVSGFGQLGTVTLSNHASVRASNSATAAGTVVLRAGKLIVDGAEIGSEKISIDARESALFRNSVLAANDNPRGKITVDAGQVQLTKSIILATGAPQGSTVVLNTPGTVSLDNSRIDTGAAEPGAEAGNISITAGDSVRLSHGTMLASNIDVTAFGGGKAGTIVIDTGKTFVSDASTISARAVASHPLSQVAGGTVEINATKQVRLEGSRIDTGAEISASCCSDIKGGDVRIQAGGSLQLLKGTVLTSDVGGGFIPSRGGTVELQANRTILMEGSRVDTSTRHGLSSRAGDILLRAGDSVQLLKGSALVSEARATDAEGSKIVIDAGRNILVDGSHLSAKPFALFPGGEKGGEVNLSAGNSVRLLHGSSISADNGFGYSSPPKVTIKAGGDVLVDASRISVEGGQVVSKPLGGQIGISAGQSVRLLNGSQLSVDQLSSSRSTGGHIGIQAGTTFVGQDSAISARAIRHGGDIAITAPDQVRFTRSLVNTSTVAGAGPTAKGGTMAITSETVRLENSRVFSTSDGTGGSITIRTNDFQRDGASIVDVRGGVTNGDVNVQPLP